MNILVTGGAGFIGANFVHYWLDKYPKDYITVYDKLTYAGNPANLNDIKHNKKFNFIKEDICAAEKFRQTLKDFKIDTIVHFAAETHVDRSINQPEVFIRTNIIGTFTILEAVKDNPKIRLHHVSTDEVFGSLPLNKPQLKFSENSAYDPQSPYSASKAAADHLVRSYINTYKIKATISNCSNNYGPYCFPEKLIPLAITRGLMNQNIPVYGHGQQIRDWIHVSDHCLGIDLILKKGKLGSTYILGGDGEQPNISVLKAILKILGKSNQLLIHVGDRKGHDQRYAMDYTKAKRELNFKPEKNFEQHLQDTVKWYKDNKNWWLPLKTNADKIAEKYLAHKL